MRGVVRDHGIGRAVETIMPLLPLVKPAHLRAVLKAEQETATAQRLGYVLEQAHRVDLADVVESCLPAKLPLTRLVSSPVSMHGARRIARWRLLDNSGEFPS